MRPIFTIHAGEFAVGEFIAQNFSGLNIWIPTKDTGIDLLVTDKINSKTISLQVKSSKNYKSDQVVTDFDGHLAVGGWFTLSHEKIVKSTADYWVFVLMSHEGKTKTQFIIISPDELLTCLINIHGKAKDYRPYLWVTKSKVALDGRGLRKSHKEELAAGSLELGSRDLSRFLNDWSAIKRLADNKVK